MVVFILLEIKELMIIMKSFVKEGKFIILIIYKLDEIWVVVDKVIVICCGKSIEIVFVVGVSF